MSKPGELDLTAVEWPICLIEFKRFLNESKADSRCRVLIQDPDVVETVKMIVKNSSGKITEIHREGKNVRICIDIDDSLDPAGKE